MSCITKILSFVLVLICIQSSYAHTYLSAVFLNNEKLNENDCIRPHPAQEREYPLPSVTSNDMTCGWLPSAAQPANRKCPIAAGSKIGIQWQHAYNNPDDFIIEATHKGPVIFYLAKSETGSGNVWFKIYEDGLVNGRWGVDRLLDNKGRVDVTIPIDIAPGNYLLRGEVLALHNAYDVGGIQPYVGCVELSISGSGSATPSGVAFPGAYTPTGPGMVLNIYQPYNSYTIPGPAIYKSGSVAQPTNSPATAQPTNAPNGQPTNRPPTYPPNTPAATTRPTSAPSTPAPNNNNGQPTSAPSTSGCGNLKVTSANSDHWLSYGKTVTKFSVDIKNEGSQASQVKFKLSRTPIEIWSVTGPDSEGNYGLPAWFSNGLPAGNTLNFGYNIDGEMPLTITFVTPSCNGGSVGQPTNAPSTNAPATAQPTNAPSTNVPSTAQPTNAPVTAQPTNAPSTTAPTSKPGNQNPIVLMLNPGSNQWWAGLQVHGGGETIVKVEWKDSKANAAWISLVDQSWAYVFTENTPQDLPIDIRVTSSTGKQVTFDNVITSWDPVLIDTGRVF